MKKIKVSEATGKALDWLVQQSIGWLKPPQLQSFIKLHKEGHFNFCTDWAQGGPIIEHKQIDLVNRSGTPCRAGIRWSSKWHAYEINAAGPTPLIAAMRCYVASKLGEEVEIPKELS